MRRAELARLELDNLNRERGTLYVRQGKGKKDRVAVMSSADGRRGRGSALGMTAVV